MRPPTIDLLNALVVGADHPSTSREAAAYAQRFALGRLGGIVELLIDNPAGLADFEGSELMGLPPDTYRPLRGKLVKLGVVVNTGKRRETPSGCEAIVWALASRQQEVQR
jgi:hypothetical protein